MNDFFGYSVSNAGDVNGDGFDDVIVDPPVQLIRERHTFTWEAVFLTSFLM